MFSIVGIILLGLIGGAVYLGITTQGIVGERYVEIPFSASVECQQSGTSKFFSNSIATNGEWISDKLPTNTNEWDIVLKGGSGVTGKRFEYYICPSKSFCSNRNFATFSSTGGSKSLGSISSDMNIWVQYQTVALTGWKGFDEGVFDVTYKPFKLIRDDPLRGGRQEISDTCEVSTSDSSWKNRITKYLGEDDWKTWEGTNKLRPGDFYNYITANVVAVTEGNLQDGGWCFYENGQANIFAIETIETASDSYNRVNLDNPIGEADCCNNEAIPGGVCKNGVFIPIEEAECETRADCGIIEWSESGDYEVQKPSCVNNKCVFETKEVDCTEDNQCKTGEFCSRNTFTCKTAGDEGEEGEEREGEELSCEWWQTEHPPETKTNIFGSTREIEASCKISGWIYGVVGGIVFIVIIFILILVARISRPRIPRF